MDNPTITWVRKSGGLCLKFTFVGCFTQHDALHAIQQWRKALASKPRERIVHIWDCQDMVDYDQEAKKMWIDTCQELRAQIDSIWLISNSLLIWMGARIISLVTSLRIKIVKSDQEILL